MAVARTRPSRGGSPSGRWVIVIDATADTLGEGASLVAVDEAAPVVVLTYDDGPTPGVTDTLVRTLADRNATATFFVLLSRARKQPEILREALAAGHELGLHGRDHRRLPGMPPETVRRQLSDGRSELEDLAQTPVRWFRPPYGEQDLTAWRAARSAGLTPVLWSVECRDWLTLDIEQYLSPVRASTLRGAIVLLHDGYADESDGVDDGPPPQLDRLVLTERILAEAAARSLDVRSVGRAVDSASPTWRVWLTEAAG